MKKSYLRLVIAIICITILTVAVAASIRIKHEKQNDEVEITLNYSQLEELAEQSEEDIEWWLRQLSQAGATSVAIIEDSLIEFMENAFINYWTSGDLKKDYKIIADFSDEVKSDILSRDDYDLVIMLEDMEDYNRILNGLTRYDGLSVKAFGAKEMVIIIDRGAANLLYEESNNLVTSDGSEGPTYKNIVGVDVLEVGIGFDENVIEMAQEADLNLLLRPINSSFLASDMVDNYIEEIEKYDRVVPLLLTTGGEVLGYKSSELDYVNDIDQLVSEYGFKVGLVESAVQRSYGTKAGLDNLVSSYELSNFVRVFSVWDYIQERYIYPGYEHGEEIGNSMYRAITERNIRVIYFNPFKWNEFDYVTNIEDYQNVFMNLEERISAHGYKIGSFSVLDDLEIPLVLRIMLYAEVLMAGIVLLNEGVMRLKLSWNLVLIAMTIPFAWLANYVAPNFGLKVFALLASMTYSTLAFIVFYKVFLAKDKAGNFANGMLGLVSSASIALLGGLMIGSVMARTDYFLEINFFTGVKISLLGPIGLGILFVALEYIKEKTKDIDDHKFLHMWKELIDLMKIPVRAGHLILLGMILVVGYIYLARTGHESGVEPMTIEVIVRNFLENVLIARPRNKEFLIAFPVIVLSITYRGYINKWFTEIKYALRTIVTGLVLIGYTSITNTFSHIRTPLYLSSVRTLISIILGLGLALLVFIFMGLIRKLIRHYSL